jgi:hypothetical protein
MSDMLEAIAQELATHIEDLIDCEQTELFNEREQSVGTLLDTGAGETPTSFFISTGSSIVMVTVTEVLG